MDKPTKALPRTPEQAQQLIDKFSKCSRDHLLTYLNDEVCIALAKNWKEVDAGINQALRDMAKAVTTKEADFNLNAIQLAGSQIISRLHEFAERGVSLISTDK